MPSPTTRDQRPLAVALPDALRHLADDAPAGYQFVDDHRVDADDLRDWAHEIEEHRCKIDLPPAIALLAGFAVLYGTLTAVLGGLFL